MTDTVSIASGSTASPNPAPAPLPIDLSAAIVATNEAASAAVAAAEAAAADREQTGEDRVAAGNSAGAALTQAGLADAARTAAETARDTAQKWATQTDAEVVAGQGYGAKKYALDAAGHAGEAAGQVGLAAAQVTLATTAKTDAVAAKGAAESARDLTLGYRDTTQTLKDSASALALQAQGYMNSAAASAASASAVSGLSNLSAAARAIATAADVTAVCIYDTSLDSDGGAWREKVAHTSWMQEALNTATRGATAKFPAKALVVGRSGSNGVVTIYDLTDPACPMWRIFTSVGSGPVSNWLQFAPTCVAALGGRMVVGTASGLYECDFVSDALTTSTSISSYLYNGRGVATSNAGAAYSPPLGRPIVNSNIGAVAATVLPLTPANPLRCGLPNVTLAVGTAGGVSVLRWDGVVCNSASTTAVLAVAFSLPDGARAPLLWSMTAAALNVSAAYVSPAWVVAAAATFSSAQIGVGTLKTARAVPGGAAVGGTTGSARIMLDAANPANSLIFNRTMSYATGYMPGAIKLALAESSANLASLVGETILTEDFHGYTDTATMAAGGWVDGSTGGSSISWDATGGGRLLLSNPTTATGLASRASATTIGRTYVVTVAGAGGGQYVGVQNAAARNAFVVGTGNVAFVFTATAATTYINIWSGGVGSSYVGSITIRACVADRSPAGNNAITHGALTRSVVATGAEMAAIGGFGATNYLRRAYSAAFDPGAGDLSVMAIVVTTAAITKTVCFVDRSSGLAPDAMYRLWTDAEGKPKFTVSDGSTEASVVAPSALPAGVHCLRGILRRAAGKIEIEVDGVIVATASASAVGAISNPYAEVTIGNDLGLMYPMDVAGPGLALVQVSMSAPTPDQCAAMWAAHAQMATPGAKILLAGSANVQGLAYDPDTDQTAVATAAGTSVFRGMTRVGYTSVAGVNDAAKLSSDNHKAVAFAGGDLVIGSAAQVYGSLAAADGLRVTARARKQAPVYDPSRGVWQGVTTDATPTVIAAVPIPEGRAARFQARVAAVQYGGVATERAVYVVSGVVTRDLGGNAAVTSVTTTMSEVTATLDCVAAANTTAQTLEIKATGKAATRLAWVAAIDWDDSGLMGAA